MAMLFFFLPGIIFAQTEKSVAPVGRTYAISNATIIQAPGRKIEKGTVIVKDGLITAVSAGATIPPDAVVIKGDSLFVYAGFIDGLSHTGVTKPKEEKDKEKPKDPGNPPADRVGLTPQNDVRDFLNPNDKSVEELRNLGFTVSQVVPYGNFLPGRAAIVLLGGNSPDDMVLVSDAALYSELRGTMGLYPNTVMAVMAKWRELYRNASLSKSYQSLYASNKSASARPANDRVLEAFYPVIDQKLPVLFKSEQVMETQRIFTLKNDLNFQLIIANVKEGWPILNKIKSSGAKTFLSLDLPDEVKKENTKTDQSKKETKTAFDLEREALEKRQKESIGLYTSQAKEFNKAGIVFGFSALSAKTKDISANLRRIIAAGLTEDETLAALTTNPAKLLGLDDRLGTIDNGKIANLVLTDKPYFNEKAKVKYVFVDGTLYETETKAEKKPDAKVVGQGTWNYSAETPDGTVTGKIIIKEEKGSYSGTISNSMNNKTTELKNVSIDKNKLTFSFVYDDNGSSLNVDASLTIDKNSIEGTMTPGGTESFPVKGTRDPKSK